DRRFLDNVVNSTLVAEGEGAWREYEGGVEDWLIQSRRAKALATGKAGAANIASASKQSKEADTRTPVSVAAETAAPTPATPPVVAQPKRKLSYKEQRELDELPGRIEALETEQAELNRQLADPDIYRKEGANVGAMHARVELIDEELLTLLERWETLGRG
ncbi:MAG: hypothetical protein RLZZ369_544, partial [Pseudomonadota bacterium]